MKKSILSLLAVAAMVSCTQNDMDLKGSDEQVEIKLKSTALSIDAATRAPYEGPISASAPLKAKVLLSSVGASNGDYSSANTSLVVDTIIFEDVKTNSATFGFVNPQYYPVNPATKVALVGLYPAKAAFAPSSAMSSYASTTYDITVLGNEDLMVAPEVQTKKSDVVGVTAGSEVYPTLDFQHLLTRLDMKVVAKDSAAYKAWGKIKEIAIIKTGNAALKNVISVNLTPSTTPGVTYDPVAKITGSAASFPCYVVNSVTSNYTDSILNGTDYTKNIVLPVAADATSPTTIASDAKIVAYSMITPFNATTSATIDLNIITENSDPAGYAITVPLTLDASISSNPDEAAMRGKKIVVTLTFAATEIVARASVASWENGGTADGTIE